MPIEFACPSCSLRYSVKDELAGKGAKCGKCGHRMRIPKLGESQPSAARSTSAKSTATKSSAQTSKVAASAPKKPAAAPKPAASLPKLAPLKPADNFGASWLDDDLETAQPAATTVSRAGAKCPACGAVLPSGSVLCVTCGFDTRTGAKLETKHELEPVGKKAKKRSALGTAGSLMRGTLFSFLGAMLGALIWAVFTYLTMWESGYIAWGLGGLAGLGMALGHEDTDGTFAGIIAAFMSLLGIIVAKVLIIVFMVAAIVGEIDIEDVGNPLEDLREDVAIAVAEDKMEREGVDIGDMDEEQYEAAIDAARIELQDLDEDALEERLAKLDEAAEADAAAKAVANAEANPAAEDAVAADDIESPDEEIEDPGFAAVGFLALLLMLFGPIDGLFILLAFFTAYKVGSGQATD